MDPSTTPLTEQGLACLLALMFVLFHTKQHNPKDVHVSGCGHLEYRRWAELKAKLLFRPLISLINSLFARSQLENGIRLTKV